MMKKSEIQIYLSHGSEDKPEVLNLYNRLKEAGYKPWLNDKDLIPGQTRRDEIPKVIKASQIFLACLSAKSANKQGYIQRELKIALNTLEEMPSGTIFLIPVRLENCDIPDLRISESGSSLRDLQWVDYWEEDGFEQLKRAIATKIDEVVDNLELTQPTADNKKNQISQFPQICNFDLNELRDNCLNKCLERKAIIGFTIACDSDAFLSSLCQRLKNEFDRSNTLIKDTLSLSPKFISVKEAITKIVRYKRLLATKNVICPVRIQVFKSYEDSSHISQHFWQSLCDEIYKSSEQVKYSLIVVMTGSEDSIFPSSDSAITLEPPQFSPAHIYVWIRDIVERLDWAESIINEWQQIMMNECCDNNSLDVRYVYEHLSESLQILQQNPSVEAESFLTELKRRNQLYA